MPKFAQYRSYLVWLGFLAGYCALAQYTAATPSVGDEFLHYGYIDRFYHGDFHINDRLAMIPGYHALVAGILALLGVESLAAARLVNAAFGLCAIAAFHALRSAATGERRAAPTLQFALLPILLPLDFMVYTDVLSLAMVLGASALTLRGKHVWSGVLLLAAMTVRQTNVVWIMLLWSWAVWQIWISPQRTYSRIVLQTLPYLIDILAFLVFWIWNGKIALSDTQAVIHPDFSFHSGNLFFTLFLVAILFPFHVTAGLAEIVRALTARPWLILVPAMVFAFYWWSFHVDHPLNYVARPLFLRNYIADHAEAITSQRIAFGLIALAAVFGLARTTLRPPVALLLYPVAGFALCAAWLIEPRYALIPLSLWMAARTTMSPATEYATTIFWAVLAATLWLGTFSGRFML